MDELSFTQAVLKYGQAPIVRGIAWALAGLLASKGVTSAQAGLFADAIWPSLAALTLATVSFIHSVRSDKDIHNGAVASK